MLVGLLEQPASGQENKGTVCFGYGTGCLSVRRGRNAQLKVVSDEYGTGDAATERCAHCATIK